MGSWRRRGRGPRIGLGGLLGAASLGSIIVLATLLSGRADRDEVAELVAYARAQRVDPLALVLAGARSHRAVFLGDVHAAGEPKRIAAEAIELLATGPGLDAVLLEVAADQQIHIDRYLASDPEDVSVLTANPRTLRRHAGAARDYVELYRRVWRLNRSIGPERRIRVIAADLPGWPPDRRLPPRDAARLFAERDAHMARLLMDDVLGRNPRARALVFMSGFHGLKAGRAEVRVGGAPPAEVRWLAARVRERYPADVFSVILDGAPRAGTADPLRSYGATRFYDLLRRHVQDLAAPFGLRVDERFDFLQRPFAESAGPGLSMIFRPDDYRLRDVVDGYVFLGIGRGLQILR